MAPPEPTRLRLRPPRRRVERRAALLWLLRALCATTATVGALTVAYLLAAPARPWLGPALAVTAAVGLAYVAVMPWRRYAVHRWETTGEAVYAVSGWIVHEWRVAPISRIQTVDTVRGPLQQLLGLSTLVVTTASSSGAIHITGVSQADAETASTQLAAAAELIPGDAT